jgi:hypothetical protein
MDPALSQQSRAQPMGLLSWFMVGIVTLLAGFAQWVRGDPSDIGGAIGRTLGTLIIPLAIAYLARGRRGNRNWNSFARWYFWLALILSAIQFKAH